MKFNTIDRKTYLYKGTWQNPDEDVAHIFFYYYINPLTLKMGSQFGKQMVTPTCIIGVAGKHPFVKGDVLTLHDGTSLQVRDITFEYYEGNIKVRQYLLPRVKEMMVELV